MKYPYTSKRVAATLIDYTLIYALTFFFVFKAGTPDGEGGYRITGLPTMIPFLFWLLYFVIIEQYMGGTMGHQLFRLKVISLDNNKVSFRQTLARRLCDAIEISWCFGLIAFLLVKNSEHNQRLGDLLAKTRVVGKDDQIPEERFDFEGI